LIRARGSFLGQHGLRSRSAFGLLMSVALVGSAVMTTSAATAAPKPTVTQVERKVEKLREQAEQASEAYNDTREELKSVNVRLKAAHAKVIRQRTELAKAKAKVGQLASETYRRGQLSTLDLVLGDDPDSALAQAGYLPSLGERQAAAMNRLADGEAKLAATEADIQAQQTKAEAGEAKLEKTRATVRKRLKAADAQLRSLNAAQRDAVNNSDGGDVPAGAGSAFCAGKAVDAPSAAAKAAITFGCAQIGEPYLWAAAGPDRWDCSGFTMKAYEAAGISLPHSSRLQAGYGTRVSTSSLLPGDLVFFHSPISHVGMYIGDGLMVHAPHSGTTVKVASLYETPSAAVRLG
jgi:cell wall-associated NlpC family hydrolase